MTFAELYATFADEDVKKALSHARDIGHQEGSDESRVDLLFQLKRAVEAGGDALEFINYKLDKMRRNGRIPEGFDREAGD